VKRALPGEAVSACRSPGGPRRHETSTEPGAPNATLVSINLALVAGYVDTVGFVALFGLL
jgi:hypothetical protein